MNSSAYRMLPLAALVVFLLGCKPAAQGDAAGDTDDMRTASGSAGIEAQGGASTNEGKAPAEKGGAFAREPGFQLPVPVSNAPVSGYREPASRQLDPAAVRTAVLEGLRDTKANVQVQVNPQGIVSLTGEVENVAQLQRAHYLARALPGVVEVDYRNLRVRQR